MESPALSADLLLGFALDWERVRVLAHPEQIIQEESWALFRGLVLRRTAGEPLQYMTGKQEFYGLVFRVTPEVLIPRPETEILVGEAVDLMKRRSLPRIRFVDVGTGSGCIAVCVAHAIPSSVGCAIDVSAAALEIARENASSHGVLGRIQFVQADLLKSFPEKPCFDLVLSNPPYVAAGEYDNLPAVVRDHEPRTALYGGESGLDVYRSLIPEASLRLVEGGRLLLELGAGQTEQITRMVEGEKLSLEKIINDLQGIPRCLVARKPLGRKDG